MTALDDFWQACRCRYILGLHDACQLSVCSMLGTVSQHERVSLRDVCLRDWQGCRTINKDAATTPMRNPARCKTGMRVLSAVRLAATVTPGVLAVQGSLPHSTACTPHV